MFKVIRVSSDYEVALVQEVRTAAEDGPGQGQVHLRRIGHFPTDGWQAITDDGATGYFSGIADGLGLGDLPREAFESLEQATLWMDRAILTQRIKSCEVLLQRYASQKFAADIAQDLEQARAELAAFDAAHP